MLLRCQPSALSSFTSPARSFTGLEVPAIPLAYPAEFWPGRSSGVAGVQDEAQATADRMVAARSGAVLGAHTILKARSLRAF